MQLLLTEKVTFGIPVVVHAYAHSNGAPIIQNITIPSLDKGEIKCCNVSKDTLTAIATEHLLLPLSVCSMKLEGTVKECDGKRCERNM